jgi:hypothetical protein
MPIYETRYGQGLGSIDPQTWQMVGQAIGAMMNPQVQADFKAGQADKLRNEQILREAKINAAYNPATGEVEHLPLARDRIRQALGMQPLMEAKYGEVTHNPYESTQFVYGEMPGAVETQKDWFEAYGGNPNAFMSNDVLKQELVNELMRLAVENPRQGGAMGIQQALQQQQRNAPYISNPLSPPTFERGGKVKAGESGASALAQLKQLLDLDRGEVPAILHEGEYVINKESAEAIGRDMLNELNNIQSLQSGGPAVETTKQLQREDGARRSYAGLSPEELLDMAVQAANRGDRETSEHLRQLARERSRNMPTSGPQAAQAQGNLGPTMNPQQQTPSAQPVNPSTSPSGPYPNPMSGDTNTRQAMQVINEIMKGVMGQVRGLTEDDTTHGTRGLGNWDYPLQPAKQDNSFVGGSTPGLPPSSKEPESEGGGEQERQAETQEKEETEETQDQTVSQTGQKASPTQQPVFGYRPAGSSMPINWQQVSQMDPAQAAQYLQRVANTQGQYTNIPTVEQAGRGEQIMPPNQRLFGQLMQQYRGVQKGEQGDVQTQAMQYELDKLAAESPYFKDLAKANLDLKNAKVKNLLAQAMYNAERNRNNIATMMSPSDALSAMQKGMDLRQDTLENLRKNVENLRQIKEENNKPETRTALAKAKLKLALANGTISPDADAETIRKIIKDEDVGFGSLFGRGEPILDDDTIQEVKTNFETSIKPALYQHKYFEDLFGLLTGRPSPSQVEQMGTAGSEDFLQEYNQMMNQFMNNQNSGGQ